MPELISTLKKKSRQGIIIIVIFKRLSLKALSDLQNHEGAGGTGGQNNYTKCFSQTLHNYTSTH